MSRRPMTLKRFVLRRANAPRREGSPLLDGHHILAHSRWPSACTASAGCPPPRPGWGPGRCLPGDTEHFIGGAASAAAVQSDLDADGGIVAVFAEAFKDAPLVLRPRQTVIYILKGNGLGESRPPACTGRRETYFEMGYCPAPYEVSCRPLPAGLSACAIEFYAFFAFSQSASPSWDCRTRAE